MAGLAFVEVVNLQVGDRLQTADGGEATVEEVTPYHSTEVTYDLTIDQLHTYYVLAGDTPVLVHNCGTGEDPGHVVGKGDDPQVPQLVEDINGRYPGHVRAQGIEINGSDGKPLTDFDIVTRNAVI